MLNDDLSQYVALHEALGFGFRPQRLMLRSFVAFAEQQGDQFIIVQRVLAWAVQARSPEQRRIRLLTVRRFAVAMHAEDDRHEIPPADAFGRGLYRRRVRHIYDADEIRRLIAAAGSLSPTGTIRPLTYATLFGLLAATGMRISEAIALRLNDITRDGIIIANTKFHKSRLLPLHPTTWTALNSYLAARLAVATHCDSLFIANNGSSVHYERVSDLFRQLARKIGIRGAPGQPGPRIHDLRHTFAVRSLEQCSHDPSAISRHIVALS